jgi:prepilin-type N-terminal cleavage/methylation domain-containing protein
MARDGHTLLELLIVLAILSLLPVWGSGLSDLVARERRYLAVLELRRELNYARATAVNLQTDITLCAIDGADRCQRNWNGLDFATFRDDNRNRTLDHGEILRRSHWPSKRGLLSWRASLRRHYIVFHAGGNTAQNGSFVYCPRGGESNRATLVTVNRAGRNYVRQSPPGYCG